jgi:hypothetical protein
MAPKANIFDKAKKAEPKKEEKHEVVNLPELESSLSQMAQINEKLAELEAQKAILDSEIREAGKEAMINLYNSKRNFPGTLKIKAGSMSFQFITSDRYKKIDEERFNDLANTYGENLVEEETIYSFNTAILMKHMEHISELLMGSKKISDSDKENLLTSETSYSVKKGTLKDLFSFKTVKNSVEGIVEDIQPVFSVKSVQKD